MQSHYPDYTLLLWVVSLLFASLMPFSDRHIPYGKSQITRNLSSEQHLWTLINSFMVD